MLQLRRSLFLICLLWQYLCIGQFSTTEDEAVVNADCEIHPDEADETGLLVAVIVIYCVCLACAIFNFIYLVKFYQNNDDPNIEARHPRLVYVTVIIVLIMQVVLFPLAIDFWTLECVTHTTWLRREDEDHPVPTAVSSFLIIAFVLLIYAWLILVVLRVWLLRFDYGASLAKKNQIWKKDLGVDGGSSTWWINNQMTWGKETFLAKIVAGPYLAAVLLSILLSPVFFLESWNAMTFTAGGVSIFLCCFVIVNVWKVRSIHDNFRIKDEILLFAKSSLSIAAVLLIVFVISRVVPDANVSNYIVLIWSILVMLLLTVVSYIQTGWVLYSIRRKREKSEKLMKSINNEWESNVSLSTVLRKKEGFEIFMDFLVAEYSTENLLCYVEATQFLRKWKHVIFKMKTLLIEQQNNENNDDNTNKNGNIPENSIELKSSQELVNEAMRFIQKNADSDVNDDDIDKQPWSFQDKETILIKFIWVKKSPVILQEITFLEHFRYLKHKYIDNTSAHQVNIRSALYKHYTKIKDKDCDLSQLDIADVFHDDISNFDVSAAKLSPQMSASYNDTEIDESKSLQPGMAKNDDKNDNNNRFQNFDGIESPSNKRDSSRIRKSHTSYNRNLRNLYGAVKVFQLIEDTRKELWKLMHDSFVRFRSTETYIEYIKDIYLNRKKSVSVSVENQQNDALYTGLESDNEYK